MLNSLNPADSVPFPIMSWCTFLCLESLIVSSLFAAAPQPKKSRVEFDNLRTAVQEKMNKVYRGKCLFALKNPDLKVRVVLDLEAKTETFLAFGITHRILLNFMKFLHRLLNFLLSIRELWNENVFEIVLAARLSCLKV